MRRFRASTSRREKFGSRVVIQLGRIILPLAFLFFFSVTAAAEPESPKMFIPQDSFDFGSVSEGQAISHDFQIENKGTAPLHIQRVVPACGCTSASNTEFVEPGQSGVISVKFDTTGFAGNKVKTVRVYTNDTENPASVLTLKGSIIPDITLEPKRVLFEDVLQGKSVSKEVTVSVRDDSELKLTEIESHSPYVEVEALSSSAKEMKFRVTLSPDLKLGEFRERVAVKLTGGDRSAVNIPIFASVKGPLRLDPTSVSFGILEGTEPLTRSVRFENFSDKPVEILALSSNNPAVKVSQKTVRKGQIFVIQVTVDPKEVSSDLRALIDIKTSSEEHEELSLSVYGVLPPKA